MEVGWQAGWLYIKEKTVKGWREKTRKSDLIRSLLPESKHNTTPRDWGIYECVFGE